MTNALWIGPIAVAALAAAWLAVQTAWSRAFPEHGHERDPLAGRLGCRGCGECERECESGSETRSGRTLEGPR